MPHRLTRRFYRRDPVTLARALLGQLLVRIVNGRRLSGIIVETEAYLGIPDLAAHTARGRRTPRNATMWGDAGHAYIYFTYGLHHCLNVVSDLPGVPTAVLIRALQPVQGIHQMHLNRSQNRTKSRLIHTNLCSGPAKLTHALRISRSLDAEDLTSSTRLFIQRAPHIPKNRIITTSRIGIPYAGPWARKPLRFYIANNPHVSSP